MVRKILLGCGIVSSVLYVVSDVIGNLLYEGYSYTDNTWSELFAIGAPTRSLMLSLNIIPGTLLGAAFAVGVFFGWALLVAPSSHFGRGGQATGVGYRTRSFVRQAPGAAREGSRRLHFAAQARRRSVCPTSS